MKILFDNVLKSGTYSSTNASANFPARNLADNFLRVRYQANATGDSVDIKLSEPVTIDSFFMGYVGNVNDIEVAFFNDGDIQLTTLGDEHGTGETDVVRTDKTTDGAIMHFGDAPPNFFDDYAGEQFVSRHFGTLTTITDEIVITLTGDNPFYIGGIAAGESVDMPSSLAGWDDGYEDNSIVARSSHGQVQAHYIEPYNRYVFSWEGVSPSDYTAVRSEFKGVGSKPVWVTFFEESPDVVSPGYYTANMTGNRRSERTYSFEVEFTEAR